MPSRRSYLACLAAGGASAGCLHGSDESPEAVEPDRTSVRGEADPLTVRRAFGDDSDVEYDPEADRVVTDDGSVDVRDWLGDTAPRVAREELDAALASGLDDENVRATLRYVDGSWNLSVVRQTVVAGDRRVVASPDASLEAVVAVTPASVTAVVTLEEFQVAWSDPIHVEDRVVQLE